MKRCCLVPVFVLVGAACSDSADGVRDGHALELSRRDSAGVEIIENVGSASALPEWTLPAEPQLRLGALEGAPEYQFFRVASAVRLGDGTVVVANGGSSEIRVFHPGGTLRASFGSEGEGPEEFRSPWSLWPTAADTILVYDWRNQRLSRWTLDGEFVEVRPLLPKFVSTAFAAGRFSDGTLLFTENPFDIPERGFEWSPLVLHRYDPTGALRDTVTRVPGWKLGHMDIGNSEFVGSPHFSATATAIAADDHIILSMGDAYELRMLDLSGELVRLIRWEGPDRTVADADISRAREDQLARAQTDEQRQRAGEFFDATPAEDQFATLTRLTPVSGGGVWALEFARPGDSGGQRWLAFDEDWRLLGRVLLPPRASLQSVGPDHLTVVERDDLDVEYVSVYALPWESTEPG